MRKLAGSIGVVLLCLSVLSGCGGESHEGEVKTAGAASTYKGKNYQEVVASFEKIGFTDISTEALEDLVTGWLTKDGEVESVSIGGDDNFPSDHWYPADSKVIVTYHTFPPEENTTETEQTNETKGGEETVTEELTEEEILTIDNCEDFANIISLGASGVELDPAYISFVETYKYQTIEFDGCITYVTNHENYNTRYDILLNAGDYVDDDTETPPIFKFEDVNTYSLGLEDMTLPSFVRMGANIHIIAKVDSINENTGIIELNPISISER